MQRPPPSGPRLPSRRHRPNAAEAAHPSARHWQYGRSQHSIHLIAEHHHPVKKEKKALQGPSHIHHSRHPQPPDVWSPPGARPGGWTSAVQVGTPFPARRTRRRCFIWPAALEVQHLELGSHPRRCSAPQLRRAIASPRVCRPDAELSWRSRRVQVILVPLRCQSKPVESTEVHDVLPARAGAHGSRPTSDLTRQGLRTRVLAGPRACMQCQRVIPCG
jgi:hypothetical protein